MNFNEWGVRKLFTCAKFQEGYVNPSQTKPEYFGGPIKWLRANDLNNSFVYDTSRRLSEEGFLSAGKSALLFKPDTLAISKSGTIGRLGILKDYMCGNRAVINIAPLQEICEPLYIFYFLLLNQSKIEQLASGSVQKNLYISVLGDIDINLPELETQRKIVNILSSIDDKIENNIATNQTLEDISRRLFKEWFVSFNYSGADGKMKLSEFGEIPANWEIGMLGDIYKTTSGGTPSRNKSEYYESGIIGWVKSKELNNSFIIKTEEKITIDALKNSSAKLLPMYSVLIAMYGATVGEVGIITDEFACNQAICAFLPNDKYPFSFIYNFLLNAKEDIISRAVGSAQQNISQQLLLQYKLVIPPTELVQEYHRIIFPLFQKIQDNIEENEHLKDLRDRLLPKLMSGEIIVNPSTTQ